MGTEAVKLQNYKIISDLFQQGCIKLIRPYSKDIYNIYSYFELSIHQRFLKKMYCGFHKNMKLHNCFQHW